MTRRQLLRAELRKAATLPGSLAAVLLAVLGSLGITLLNASGIRAAVAAGEAGALGYTSPAEAAFAAVPLGTVGAIVLGVVAVSSEYATQGPDAGGGRQITATLTAAPGRLGLLAAKAGAVAVLVVATAAVTLPACLFAAHLVAGDAAGVTGERSDVLARSVGVAVYWTLTAMIACAFTVLTRSGIVPLVVLVANSSLVSVSVLLARLTGLAYYLPDLAGLPLFARGGWSVVDQALDPLTGGLVMAAWAVGLLVVAAGVLARRDA